MVKQLPIRWSRKALETLNDGLGYIAQFNPEGAHQLRLSIQLALEHVREFPKAAHMVPEEADSRVREVLREPFRVIYEIHPKELRILAVRRMERAPIEPKDLEQG